MSKFEALTTAVAIAITSMTFMSRAQAATVFFDDFNSDTPGLSTTPTGWSLTQGSVDIIGGSFGYDFYPGNGYYVDLNGSTGQYGGIATDQIFAPGTYTVQFNLGSSVGGANGVDVADTPKTTEVFLGNSAAVDISLPSLPADWTTQVLTLTTTIAGSLVFDSVPDSPPQTQYAPDVGNILDNVLVSQGTGDSPPTTPLPGSWSMMLLGLAGFGFMACRRQKQPIALP